MASNDLKKFLRGMDPSYEQYAERLHQGTFTKKAELGAADKADLEALGNPKDAAGLIIKAAQATGVCQDSTFSMSLPGSVTPLDIWKAEKSSTALLRSNCVCTCVQLPSRIWAFFP